MAGEGLGEGVEGPGPNLLFCGDNLEVLRRHIADASIDLIYLDPPFNSGVRYRFGGREMGTPVAAFDDAWRWDKRGEAAVETAVANGGAAAEGVRALRHLAGKSGMLAYLAMMAPRLEEMWRVLKRTGSLYLHCDPRTSHYFKVVLDALFGAENFRNELIWSYGGRGAKAVARQFPRNHDVLLLYSKAAGAHTFRRQYVRRVYSAAEARQQGFRQDEQGRWFKTAPRGDYSNESIARLEREDRVYRTGNGRVRIKYFLSREGESVVEELPVGDVWDDIPDGMHRRRSEAGYPTQKPEALLERIIRAGSDPGDLVLDPFAGGGTAALVAQRLGRRWIAIDSAPLAVATTERRLWEALRGEVGTTFRVVRELGEGRAERAQAPPACEHEHR